MAITTVNSYLTASGLNFREGTTGKASLLLDPSSDKINLSGNFNLGTGSFTIGGNAIVTGTSAIDSDTLATVTARGATTSSNLTLNGDITVASSKHIGIGSTLAAIQFGDGSVGNETADLSFVTNSDGEITFNRGGNKLVIGSTTSVTDGDFLVDTDTLYVDASENKVGIGITTPVKELHVNGTILGKNNGGYTQYDYQGNIATVLNLTTANELTIGQALHVDSMSFNVGGTDDAMFINSSANVGIGTNPRVALDVNGEIRNLAKVSRNYRTGLGTTTLYVGTVDLTGNGDGAGFKIKVYDPAEKVWRLIHVTIQNSGGTNYTSVTVEGGGEDTEVHIDLLYKNRDGDATKTDFFLDPTATISFTQYVYVEGYIITDTGYNDTSATSVDLDTDIALYQTDAADGSNVGIGTVNPLAKLHVSGSVMVDSDQGNGGLYITRQQYLNEALKISTDDEGSYFTIIQDESSAGFGKMVFQADADHDHGYFGYEIGGAEKMRLTSGGLGIGTTEPDAPLEINAASAPDIFLRTSGTNPSECGRIRFCEATNLFQGGFIHYDGSANTFNIGVHHTSDETIGNDINAISIARADGDVGIGTTNPAKKLHVVGTARISAHTDLQSSVDISSLTRIYDKLSVGAGAAWIGPTEALEVGTDTDVSAIIGKAHIGDVGHNGYAGFSHVDKATSTNYGIIQRDNGQLNINSPAGVDTFFCKGGSIIGGFNTTSDFYVDTDTLFVDISEDRVGINRADVRHALDVSGAMRITSTDTGILYLGQTSQGEANFGGAIRGEIGPTYAAAGKVSLLATTWGVGTDYGLTEQLSIEVKGSDTKEATMVLLPHGGKVGIGTNNPLHPLQISGAAHIEWGNTLTEDLVTIKGGGSAGDYDLLKVEAANGDDLFTVGGFTYDVLMPDSDTNVGIGTTTASAKVHLNGPSAGFSEILRLQRDGGNYYSIGLDNGDLNFCYNGQSADGSILVIDGAANGVGIGTKSPSTELDVAGTGSFKRINIYNSTHNANPRLCVGRSDAEGFKFHVDDMFTKLTAHQDVDGDGDHRFIIDREFAGTGNNSFHIANSGNYQLTIDKDNKIGMGVNNPSDFNSEGNRLVIGDGAGNEGMTIYAGTSNKSSVLFADGTAGNTAYAGYVSYRHDSDRLDFGAGGGTRMVVNGNGAGIGTYTVDSKLTVSGAHSSSIAKFRNGSNTVEITDDADLLVDGKVGIGTTTPSEKLDVAGGIKLLDNNYLTWNSSSTRINGNSDYLQFQVAASDKVRIQSDGKVGIGTTAPSTRLEVVGSSTTSVDVAHFSNSSYVEKGIFRLDGAGAGEFVVRDASNNEDVLLAAQGDSYFNGGNVGIGTASPAYHLDVTGIVNAYRYIQDGNVGSDFYAVTASRSSSSLTSPDIYDKNSHGLVLGGTHNEASLVVKVGGNVGIGETNPEVKLEVAGDILAKDSYVSAGFGASDGYQYHDLGTGYGFKGIGSPTRLGVLVQGIESMTWESNGRVGIGSTNPASHALEVNGTISGDKILGKSGVYTYGKFGSVEAFGDAIYVGEVRTNSLSDKANNGNAQINFGGASKTIDFETDATIRMLLSSGGYLGIGNTSPTAPLHVKGQVRIERSNATVYGTIDTEGNYRFGAPAGYNYTFHNTNPDAGGEIVRFTTDGNVGIGTTTPYGQLDVFSSNNTETDPSNAANYHLHLHNPLDDTSESIGIGFGLTSAHSGVGAAIAHERKGSNSYGDLYFSTRPVGGDVTERMRIASDGNVGIGTSSPARNLSVASSTTNALIQLANSTTTYAADNGLEIFVSDNDAGIVNRENGYLRFDTNNIERVRITSAGNVGIGTTNATEPLTVKGSIVATNTSNVTIGGITYSSNNGRLFASQSDGTAKVLLDSNGVSYLNGGNVGIGVADPDTLLEVAGVIKSSSTSRVQADVLNNSANSANIIYRSSSTTIVGNNSTALVVEDGGDVGIGTSDPASKLHVEGTVQTKVYAIGSLPSASPAGQRAMVNNASSAFGSYTVGQTVSAGGSAVSPVYSDGSYWRYG